MPNQPAPRGGGFTPPVLGGPLYARDTLIFGVRDAHAANGAHNAALSDASPSRGLAAVLAYAKEYRGVGAAITPLHRDCAGPTCHGPGWVLAAPACGPDASRLSGLNALRLAAPADAERLLSLLATDTAVASAHRPAIQYPLDAPPRPPQRWLYRGVRAMEQFLRELMHRPGHTADEEEQWWLDRCGFRHVWTMLDTTGSVPGAIAVIDQGGDTRHPELKDRLVTKQVPTRNAPSESAHASAVAGVIAAHREPRAGISGCCSAIVHLYNVWMSEHGFDDCGYYNALRDVAQNALKPGSTSPEENVRVVNLSLGSPIDDPTVRTHIQECLDAGLILVAAAGNEEDGSVYPAAYDGVISVGATTRNPSDDRMHWSARGHISAPGEQIRTIEGTRTGIWEGTSFAAPMVAAAIWMALRMDPFMPRERVMELLEKAVANRGRAGRELGLGRLDLPALEKALRP